jgi:hypothetical protein
MGLFGQSLRPAELIVISHFRVEDAMPEAATGSIFANQTSVSFVYSMIVAAMATGGLYAILIEGPAMRAAAQQNLAQTISDENRGFCEKLGIAVESSEFALCSQELGIVRKRQADRDSAAQLGVL